MDGMSDEHCQKYTRHVSVEAVQWTGSNQNAALDLIGDGLADRVTFAGEELVITMSSWQSMVVPPGDWLVKEDDGAVRRVDEDEFAATYWADAAPVPPLAIRQAREEMLTYLRGIPEATRTADALPVVVEQLAVIAATVIAPYLGGETTDA